MIEFLENNTVKDLDPARRMEILGEGYFNRAMAHFMLLRYFGQFYDTDSPYGLSLIHILIYVALEDKQLAILGDAGINAKVPDHFWDDIKNNMREKFKSGQMLSLIHI